MLFKDDKGNELVEIIEVDPPSPSVTGHFHSLIEISLFCFL